MVATATGSRFARLLLFQTANIIERNETVAPKDVRFKPERLPERFQ